VRIAQTCGVEYVPYIGHGRELIRSESFAHQLSLLDAYAVLAREGAAELEACLQDVVPGREYALNAFGIAVVVKNDRMNVAVTGMHQVGNTQLMA
jgi:hypothetical protein